MERHFMRRTSAVALIVDVRQHLQSQLNEHAVEEARRLHAAIDELTRLLLDVRAGRTNEFELTSPAPLHITISDR
jgi:hypothetical protein